VVAPVHPGTGLGFPMDGFIYRHIGGVRHRLVRGGCGHPLLLLGTVDPAIVSTNRWVGLHDLHDPIDVVIRATVSFEG